MKNIFVAIFLVLTLVTGAFAAPVDINTATTVELKTVPGIGDAYANKIVAARPYKTSADLVKKKVLSLGVYNKVKANLVAKQVAKAKKAFANNSSVKQKTVKKAVVKKK